MAANYSVKVSLGFAFFAFLLTLSGSECGVISSLRSIVKRDTQSDQFHSSDSPYMILHHDFRNVPAPVTTTGTPAIAIKSHYTVGQRVDGDNKALERKYRKPIMVLAPKTTVNVIFPPANTENSCPITMIDIRCPNTACEMEADLVTVREGGLGEKNVKLRITSPNHYLYHYKVIIYTKC